MVQTVSNPGSSWLVLGVCRLREHEGFFLGHQENWRPTRGNLHGVSQRFFPAIRRRARFEGLHRRKVDLGNAVERSKAIGTAQYLGGDDLGLASKLRNRYGTCSVW
jgi:hypothetical protein